MDVAQCLPSVPYAEYPKLAHLCMCTHVHMHTYNTSLLHISYLV